MMWKSRLKVRGASSFYQQPHCGSRRMTQSYRMVSRARRQKQQQQTKQVVEEDWEVHGQRSQAVNCDVP